MKKIDNVEISKKGLYDLTFNYNLSESHTATMRIYKHTNGNGGRKLIYDRRVPCPAGTDLVSGDVFDLEVGTYQINVEFSPADTMSDTQITINEPIRKDGLIMVVSPHQDDEMILFAQTMAEARKDNKVVKVVYSVHDEYSRFEEAIPALTQHIKIPRRDIMTMGYAHVSKILGKCYCDKEPCICEGENNGDNAIYTEKGFYYVSGHYQEGIFDFSFLNQNGTTEKPMTLRNMRQDYKDLITLYRPSEIFTSCEYEDHYNHSATYTLLNEVLTALKKADITYSPKLNYSSVYHKKGTKTLKPAKDEQGNVILDENGKVVKEAVETGWSNTYPGSYAAYTSFPNPFGNVGINDIETVGADSTISTTPNAIWLNRLFGGVIAPPLSTNYTSCIKNGNATETDNGTERRALDINVLSLIRGTGILPNDVYGVEVVTFGQNTNRQAYIRVNGVNSPMFHSKSEANPANPNPENPDRIFVIRKDEQTLRYLNKYGLTSSTKTAANIVDDLKPFVTTETPSSFYIRIRANQEDELNAVNVMSVALLGKNGAPLGITKYNNIAKTWSAFEAYHNRVIKILSPESITQSDKLAAIEAYETQAESSSTSEILNFAKDDEYYWTKDFANIAYLATVTCSSENSSKGQYAKNVINGVISGNNDEWRLLDDTDTEPTDLCKRQEWVMANNASTGWIKLEFDRAYPVKQINLYDRLGINDSVLSGILYFSDGTFENIGALHPNGLKYAVSFDTKNISWVRFEITNSQGPNIGLVEIEVMT